MKKARKLIIATFITTVTMGLGSALAWLVPIAKFGPGDKLIDGATEGAYYAYGEGTAEQPFGISNPRHLYNLSWLQYLGMYSDGQYYFELASDIEDGVLDMSGWVIPPIGNEDNPFIGNFNGNGQIIENLVVSNDFTQYNRYPSVVNQNGFELARPKVVGFFGVIGDLNNSVSYADYDSTVNEFKNTGLSSVTVRTIAQETLVGVAAGYSDGNIYNVAIESPSIDIATDYASAYSDLLTENLSDFGVVGYTTKQGQISKVDNKIYGVNITSEIEFNAATDGTAEGWGGSVDMYDMYSRLLGVWNNFNSTHTSGGTDEFKYYTNEEITINPDGSTTINSQSGATNNRLWSSEDGTFLTGYNYYHGYYGYKQYDSDDGNKETSSYTFVIEESSGDDAYMQLSGKKEVKIPGATKTLKTNYWKDFTGKKVYVDINSTRYYLATNGTNDVTSITNEANASFWEYENNYIFTNIDGIAYYLNRSGSTVILSSSANTKWEFNSSEGGYYTHDNGTNYYLNCTTTDWNLVNPSTVGYVTLSNGSGRYITHTTNNGNTSTGTDGNSTQARWYIAGDYFKTAATGTAYYLRNNYTSSVTLNGTASTNYLYVSSSTSSRFVYKDGYLYANYFNSSGLLHHVYGYVSSNAWRRTIATGIANPPSNRTLVTVTKTEDTLNSNGAKNITFGSQTGMQINTKKNRTEIVDASFTTNHTYFPLRQKTDNPGVPDDTNTGYVVSGSGYYGDPYGDIRVSRYSKSGYLSSGTYNASTQKIATVYTINASGNNEVVYEQDYKKFADAKLAMEGVLDNDANVYGLHFMGADITYGGPDPVIAEKAVINDTSYYNYELPTDCINFNLKENGFINFFAGAYFPGNNCFFSLHQIERDGSSIVTIEEIDSIYHDVNDTAGIKSYVYKFANGDYSVPFKRVNGEKVNLDGSPYVEYSTQSTLPSGYSLAFSTSRIKINSLTSDYIYYFEIPMNEGDYCLGSVSGSTAKGAYLMYLDIAANAAKTHRTIFYEKLQETIRTFAYPLGVAIVPANTVSSSNVVDPTDTANVVIYENYKGLLTITRNALNSVYLARAAGMDNRAKPTLIGELMWDETHEQYKLHDPGNTNLTNQIVCEQTITDVKRLQFYDYNINKSELTVTTITDTSVNQSLFERTLEQVLPDGTIYDQTQIDQMAIYNQNTGTKYSTTDVMNQTLVSSDSPSGTYTLLIQIYYVQPDGVTVNLDIALEAETDPTFEPDGFYYRFADYLLEFTISEGAVTITVVQAGSGVVVVGNTTISSPGGSVTITAP